MEVFDSLEQHIQNPVVLQSILSLMDRGTMVLTTNYDNLLEIFGQQQSKPMESLDLKDKTKVWAGWAGVREVIAVDMLLASALKQDTLQQPGGRALPLCGACCCPLVRPFHGPSSACHRFSSTLVTSSHCGNMAIEQVQRK